jgi:cystathionine beta-synthase
MAAYIIRRAEEEGLLKPGGTIVENTSGNTGMGAAMTAAAKGYRAVFTMPDKMSQEKIDGLRGLRRRGHHHAHRCPGRQPRPLRQCRQARRRRDAQLVLHGPVPQPVEHRGPRVHHRARALRADRRGQGRRRRHRHRDRRHRSPASGATSRRWARTQDHRRRPAGLRPLQHLQDRQPSTPYVYKVEGLGEDIVCRAFDPSVVDEMYQVNDYECFTTGRRLTREEGLWCGGSSGGMVHIALRLAKEWGPGKKIVAILPDNASRYLSKYLNDDWMRMHGFLEPEKGLGHIADMLNGTRRHPVITATPTAPSPSSSLDARPGREPDPRRRRARQARSAWSTRWTSSGASSPAPSPPTPPPRHHDRDQRVRPPQGPRRGALRALRRRTRPPIVVDEGKIVGVLTEIDLIEHLARQK